MTQVTAAFGSASGGRLGFARAIPGLTKDINVAEDGTVLVSEQQMTLAEIVVGLDGAVIP